MSAVNGTSGPTHRGPLEHGRHADGGRRQGGGGWWVARERERREGRATSTLKQEDWNKRLAWTARGKVKPRRAGGGEGTEKKPVGAGLSLPRMLVWSPIPLRTPSSFISGPNPLSWRYVAHLRVPLLPPFLLLQRASPLHLSSFSFFISPSPYTFCSLTSSPSVSVSNCSATLRRRLSRRPPLLCSRRWQGQFRERHPRT